MDRKAGRMYFSLGDVLIKKWKVRLHECTLQKHLLSHHAIHVRLPSDFTPSE